MGRAPANTQGGTMNKRNTIGERMRELLRILSSDFGGEAPSQHALYMRLRYHGHPSNRYGHAVYTRCLRAGLLRREPVARDSWGWATRYRVEITEKGEGAAWG